MIIASEYTKNCQLKFNEKCGCDYKQGLITEFGVHISINTAIVIKVTKVRDSQERDMDGCFESCNISI